MIPYTVTSGEASMSDRYSTAKWVRTIVGVVMLVVATIALLIVPVMIIYGVSDCLAMHSCNVGPVFGISLYSVFWFWLARLGWRLLRHRRQRKRRADPISF